MLYLVKVKKNDEVQLPRKTYDEDAAYDITATSEPKVVGKPAENRWGLEIYESIDYIEYETGLFVEPGGNFHLKVYPRSSISKYWLTLANSVPILDQLYRGELLIRFRYNWQFSDMFFDTILSVGPMTPIGFTVNKSKIYQKGYKIAQVEPADNKKVSWTFAHSLSDSLRSTGGFGSTGK